MSGRGTGSARALAGAACLCWLALVSTAMAQQTGGMMLPPLPSGGLPAGLTGGASGNALILLLAMTALSLAPGIAIMVTCFPFIVTVLSILRQSLGLQQSPPNMLIVSLSMFLTWYVMDPVLQKAWADAGRPLRDGEIGLSVAMERGVEPFRGFMAARADPQTLAALAELRAPADEAAPRPVPAGIEPAAPERQLSLLIPAFMLSEIQRAFEIGFLLTLPFLIIDLVVSAVLMSMGMMMVPPAVVALPFKLAFFVVVNGWTLVTTALVRGYVG